MFANNNEFKQPDIKKLSAHQVTEINIFTKILSYIFIKNKTSLTSLQEPPDSQAERGNFSIYDQARKLGLLLLDYSHYADIHFPYDNELDIDQDDSPLLENAHTILTHFAETYRTQLEWYHAPKKWEQISCADFFFFLAQEYLKIFSGDMFDPFYIEIREEIYQTKMAAYYEALQKRMLLLNEEKTEKIKPKSTTHLKLCLLKKFCSPILYHLTYVRIEYPKHPGAIHFLKDERTDFYLTEKARELKELFQILNDTGQLTHNQIQFIEKKGLRIAQDIDKIIHDDCYKNRVACHLVKLNPLTKLFSELDRQIKPSPVPVNFFSKSKHSQGARNISDEQMADSVFGQSCRRGTANQNH